MGVPNFLTPTTHTVEIRGHELRFYPISTRCLKLLRPLAGPAAKAIDAFVSSQEIDARQRAFAELVDALAKNLELGCEVILDSLRDVSWASRPPTDEQKDDLFKNTDGPTLTAMLAAVVKVNREAFGPLLPGVPAAAARNGALTPETAGTS